MPQTHTGCKVKITMPTNAIERHRNTLAGWRDHGEGLYMLYGEAALQRTIENIKRRYPDAWQDKVEAMIEGARDAGRGE